METTFLRNKVLRDVERADEDLLKMLDLVSKNYAKTEKLNYPDLPEIIQKLIAKGERDIENGNVRPHQVVMQEKRSL